MIKIYNLHHFKSIKNAQKNVGVYSNYLIDVLKPAIERGDWDEFEQLDIGFDTSGQSLGKVGDDEAWKNLQTFFQPNTSVTKRLDFSLNGKAIERNLKNELKALILKMMWISPKEHSFETIWNTLVDLKKYIPPLLKMGVNSFTHINYDCLEKWSLDNSTQINFRRNTTYAYLNKLFIEKDGLPFHVSLPSMLYASDFNLTLLEPEQHTVIPQRLYYRALCEAETLINSLYPIRNELEQLSNYLIDFQEKIYKGYAQYLHKGMRVRPNNGELMWHLNESNQTEESKHTAFKTAFMAERKTTEAQILSMLRKHRPSIKESFYDSCYPDRHIVIGGKTISNAAQAEKLLTLYSGGCTWTLMAKSGMRGDEVFYLHTVDGCQKEVISGQTIYILHADLNKTTKGIQSKQDEFVTTELGMKAYEILQTIHRPLRESCNSSCFFHMFRSGFEAATSKAKIAHKAQNWFNRTLSTELALTNEDLLDLKQSDPSRSFNVGEYYVFTCHQLRRSFAYYLIGYELLSFPQLKQQFSHVSLAMTRHYAKHASKFQKLRKIKGKRKSLCSAIDDERISQKAQIYLSIYRKLANNERVAGGKGKEFAKRMSEQGSSSFSDKTDNDMLTVAYWENVVRNGKRHIHVVAPGIYCTSQNCSLRTQVSLIECVDCDNDYIVDAVYAEAMRKEAEIHMHYDIDNNELTPQTASELYIKIIAAERIMSDLNIDYEPVIFPQSVEALLIKHKGVTG